MASGIFTAQARHFCFNGRIWIACATHLTLIVTLQRSAMSMGQIRLVAFCNSQSRAEHFRTILNQQVRFFSRTTECDVAVGTYQN